MPVPKKFFSYLLIYTIFISAFIILFYRHNSPPQQSAKKGAPSSDWKIYNSEAFGFELKIPPNYFDWEESDPGTTLPHQISFHEKSVGGFSLSGLYLTITDRKKLQQYYMGKDPVKNLSDYQQIELADDKDITSITPATLDGQPALKVIYGNGRDMVFLATEPDTWGGPVKYITQYNGKFYIFEYYSDDPGVFSLYDQILSTIKLSDTAQEAEPPGGRDCITGGCSGEICQDTGTEPAISICIFKEEYNCLKHSVCEKQTNGICGWTQTPDYLDCINKLK
ncbi:MAG: hypothetical protein UX91_C0007G0056 [Candidatus Amesbacteria bacterium GW2011_GWB1_47_19]|nr:MAG: hypothetical protein UW51_C0006G0123 [Candidatus Amesbacteria bacterium GW2011_GWA1_44_24]KKU31840.1 MAG: hypothetical protein UX46_C0002G0056 [Candidatus Amesbacteria bacterium GW2011_GWC1_46_24]KKU66776.1 MAG: hypothetical protein UX91_C0007G0056 [Candidatus Amesbacteria bacterium GW2011_GWB1_47_19]OGD05928.1 MAG: hypothetical protein A2379_00120 [Candidatus Amesbacteria bacterium RIFOXYB1_FULL_47_13]HBC73141.1 hypothetical protein [Candidatus Amesbacteria bacterium]